MNRPVLEGLENRLLLSVNPALPVIIDDAAGFATAGTWAKATTGYQADQLTAVAKTGNSATWTFTGLDPGYQYRVAATYQAASTNSSAASYSLINTLPNGDKVTLGTTQLDQTTAPNDVTADGAAWEYLGAPVLVRGNTLSVQLTGADGKTLSADAVRLERVGTWVAPTGAATPDFGIEQTNYMYQGKTYDFGSGPQAYKDAGNGPYTHYVDNTNPNATDTSNPFGTPEKPRKTIPTTLAAGSVVEVHGGGYNQTATYTSQGTADRPVFIRGTDMPNKTTYNDAEFRMAGQYLIVENFKFTNVWVRSNLTSTSTPGSVHHIGFRHNEVSGLPPAYGTAVSSVSAQNFVVYDNYIHDNGDPNAADENDLHGFTALAGAKNDWYVDNYSHGMGGDSVQINSGNVASTSWATNIYIGRNIMHSDGENAVDLKQSSNVIVSDNIAYGYRPTQFAHSGSDGTAMIVHYQPMDTWFVNNEIYDSSNGIRSNGSDRGWIVGNVIHDIHHYDGTTFDGTAWGGNGGVGIIAWSQPDLYVAENTIYNVDIGFSSPSGGSQSVKLVNNIFGHLNESNSSSVMITSSTVAGLSTLQGNLFSTDMKVNWGGRVYTDPASLRTGTGQGTGTIEADPGFVDPANGDFRLKDGSAAVDSGVNYTMPYDTFKSLYGRSIAVDPTGVARPYGTALDNGAFEKGKAVVTPPPPTPTNTPPVAVDDTATTAADKPVTVDVLANDTDANSDVLTLASVTQPANGVAAISSGKVVYTPKAGYSGADAFTYVVSDGKGGTDTGAVAITVTAAVPANVAPVAANDTATTTSGTMVLVDVLANDTDADGDALTISAVTQAANGTVAVSGGKVLYTPKTGYSGADAFTYVVSDGKGGTDTGAVAVTVTAAAPVNIAPVAANDTATTTPGTLVLVDVLANDTDADGDTLTISAVTQPANGTAAVQNGKVAYTPKAGWVGADTFNYSIADGKGGTATASVSVQTKVGEPTPGALAVAAVTASSFEAPNAPANTIDGNLATRWSAYGDGQWIQYDLGASKSVNEVQIAWHVGDRRVEKFDVMTSTDGSTWTKTFTGASSGTTTALESYKFTAVNARYVRVVGHGNTAGLWNSVSETKVFGSATAVNTAPTAVNDAVTTKAGKAVTFNVLANDTDPDGDALAVTGNTNPANGTLTAGANGAFTYTPKAGWAGADAFTYTISDGKGGTAIGSVAITVVQPGNLKVAAVTASAAETGNPATNSIDGNLATRWSADGDGQWISYDLGAAKTLTELKIAWLNGDKRTEKFDVLTSVDGTNWTRSFSGSSSGTTSGFESTLLNDVTARFLKIVGHGNSANTWNSINEVQVLGL